MIVEMTNTMRSRIFAALILCGFLLNSSVLAGPDTGRSAKRKPAADLVALLPAADGAATIDVKRFFNSALPQLLSANQKMFAKLLGHVREIESKTGIDLRKFDNIAAAANIKPDGKDKFRIDLVAIARGELSAAAMIGVVKLASDGKYRTETIGERTVYIIDTKAIKAAAKPANGPAAADAVAGKVDSEMLNEIAFSEWDGGTLVFGSPNLVKATLERSSALSSDITSLLSAREAAVFSAAFRLPDGMSSTLKMDTDEFAKNIDSIRYLSSWIDVIPTGAALSIQARTSDAARAKDLSDTLLGLQFLGKQLLKNSKRADQQVYARLVENAKITLRDTDVSIDLKVPQADVDRLVATLK